jgi:uncharacterized membrane protein
MRQLADDLAHHLTDAIAPAAASDNPFNLPAAPADDDDSPREPAVTVTESSWDDNLDARSEGALNPADLPPQPADSRATVEHHADGLTIDYPPAGLWKGSKGLFFFAILWNAFLVVFTGLGLVNRAWPMVLFSLLFWAVGIVLLLASIRMGKRRTVIDVVPGGLTVTRKSPFGLKSWQWLAEDLQSITVGPSGVESNDEPLMQLNIQPRTGKQVGILIELDDNELRWLGAQLRHALWGEQTSRRTATRAPAELNPTHIPSQPPASNATIDRRRDALTLEFPPAGLRKASKGMFTFSLIWNGLVVAAFIACIIVHAWSGG